MIHENDEAGKGESENERDIHPCWRTGHQSISDVGADCGRSDRDSEHRATSWTVLLIVEPESGSTTEGVLGVTAAIAGLAAGVPAIAAAIYAQAKNLWNYVPSWVRGLVWTFVVLGIITTAANLINQLL